MLCGGGGRLRERAGGRVTFMPLEDQRVRVDDVLVLEMRALRGPSGLQWRFFAPSIPDLQDYARLAQVGAAASFRWAPLASQAGVHQITFVAEAPGSKDTETITVEVIQAGGVPRFIQPSTGGAYAIESFASSRWISRSSMMTRPAWTFDSASRCCPEVSSSKRPTFEPNGGGVRHRCSSIRHSDIPSVWRADDGQHAPVPHEYALFALALSAPLECSGSSPMIAELSAPAGRRLVTVQTIRWKSR